MGCSPSHASVYTTTSTPAGTTSKTSAAAASKTSARTKRGPDEIFQGIRSVDKHGIRNVDKVRIQSPRDDPGHGPGRRRVAPSHRSRTSESSSASETSRPLGSGSRRCRRLPTDTSMSSITSIASGFAEVAEDVLFLRGELSSSSAAQQQSMLRLSLQDPSVRVWHLGKNSMGDDGASVVAEALSCSTHLDLIGLGHNNITEAGAARLADAMESTKAPLRVMCFANNEIGDQGAAVIAAALPYCATLQVLDLRSNKIGPEGAQCLAKALEAPGSVVKKLQLGGNQVGDEGARVLAAAFKACPSLEELAVEENDISDEGAAMLAEALKDNSTLLLCGNKLSNEGKRAVRAAKTIVTRRGACCTVGL